MWTNSVGEAKDEKEMVYSSRQDILNKELQEVEIKLNKKKLVNIYFLRLYIEQRTIFQLLFF